MAAILRLTLRGLRARMFRLALTALAIVLGVAFMVGARVFTDTIVNALDEVLESSTAGIDLVVERESVVDTQGLAGPQLPEAAIARVAAVPGVDVAAGSVQGVAQLIGSDGDIARRNGPGFTIVTNWIETPELNPFRITEGQPPVADADLVIDRDTARRESFEIGDTVEVFANGQSRAFVVSGVAALQSSASFAGASLIATTLPAAQESFGDAGSVSRIVVAIGPDVDPDVARTDIEAALAPEGIVDLDIERTDEQTARQRERLRENLAPFTNLLTAFVFISIFVGSFLIANTFGILLAQRSREMALLRTLGAQRAQLLVGLLLEALLIGLVTAAIGLVLGLGAAVGLRNLLARSGISLPDGPLQVTTTTIVIAFAVGVIVTVGAAAAPVFRAARTRPLAAMRTSEVERVRVPAARVIVGVVMIAAGVAVFLSGIPLGVDGFTRIGIGGLGVVLGIVLAAPGGIRPVVRVLATPARLWSGPAGLLADGNARRNPRRTASTAAAVMIGASLVTFVTVLAASVKTSVDATVDRSFRADFVVDGQTRVGNGFPPELAEQLRDDPEFDAVSGMRVAGVQAADEETRDVLGVETDVIDDLVDFAPVDGTLAAVGPDEVAVQRDEAARLGLEVGDTTPLLFSNGTRRDFTVARIFDDVLPRRDDGTYIIDTADFEAVMGRSEDIDIYVGLASGVTPEAGRAALDAATIDQPNAAVRDRADIKAQVTERVDQILNLLYALLALAVIIATIGIANTLALAVHERTRELGLLRAVGMTRRQMRTSIRWEAVLVAVTGTVVGIGLAVAGASGVVRALSSEGVVSLAIPVTSLAVIAGAAVVAGVLAALGPARRAARLDILAAIATE